MIPGLAVEQQRANLALPEDGGPVQRRTEGVVDGVDLNHRFRNLVVTLSTKLRLEISTRMLFCSS